MKRKVLIYGGGTVFHVRPHFSLAAQSYGTVAQQIMSLMLQQPRWATVPETRLTKMANGFAKMETNADVEEQLRQDVDDPLTKVIFFSTALCDWEGHIVEDTAPNGVEYLSTSGKDQPRLQSRGPSPTMALMPAKKLLPLVRQEKNGRGIVRKDIFLVAFKTTAGASSEEMYHAGLHLLKENSCNLVLVNDVHTRNNMIVTPEEAVYHETTNRDEVIRQLVDMVYYRSQLTFTQSNVVDGKPIPWGDPMVPGSLRQVVDHCVSKNAYKPFRNATVGHFAVKVNDTHFLTSIRKSNFNNLDQVGLVLVKTDGPDTVTAFGAKPSVGGQSQRKVFRDHPGMDCIVHFHCPLKDTPTHKIPTVSQREVECGSHQCGENTSANLGAYTVTSAKGSFQIKAVMLDQHGPNIIFHRDTPPELVIDFIESNFDLEKKTGGYRLPS